MKEAIIYAQISETFLTKSERTNYKELIKIYLILCQATEYENNKIMVSIFNSLKVNLF